MAEINVGRLTFDAMVVDTTHEEKVSSWAKGMAIVTERWAIYTLAAVFRFRA